MAELRLRCCQPARSRRKLVLDMVLIHLRDTWGGPRGPLCEVSSCYCRPCSC